MNAHPEAIGAAVAPGRAGWCGSRDLATPARPRAAETAALWPQPDPVEAVFQYPRGNRLANRVLTDAAAMAVACRKAWDRFAAAPDRIAFIMRREWATIPAPDQANHNGWL